MVESTDQVNLSNLAFHEKNIYPFSAKSPFWLFFC